MNTPQNNAGKMTERCMEEILKRLPNLRNDTQSYNRIYEGVYAGLTSGYPKEEPPEARSSILRQALFFR